MTPVTVEHTFVTALPDEQAMQLLGRLMQARLFELDGEQQLAADRPDWTVVHFRRGYSNAARASKITEFPQKARVEWDHGRVSVAISVEPSRSNASLLQSCADLMLLIGSYVDDTMTGQRPIRAVIDEWTRTELSLAPVARGRTYITLSPTEWAWTCAVICLFAALTAFADADEWPWLVGPLSLAAAVGCMLIALKVWRVAAYRMKITSSAVTGGAVSVTVFVLTILPITHRPVLHAQLQANASPTTPRTITKKLPPRAAATPSDQSPPEGSPSPPPRSQPPDESDFKIPVPPMAVHPSLKPRQQLATIARRDPIVSHTPAELTAKLGQIPSLWSIVGNESADLLPTMLPAGKSIGPDGVTIQDVERLATTDHFAPPVTFRIVAMTDSTNIRIGYANEGIIFNWEMNKDQLRIDGRPIQTHADNVGKVPEGMWVAIELAVTERDLSLWADGQLRYHGEGDFSKANTPLSIYTQGAVVTVKSVTAVWPHKGAD